MTGTRTGTTAEVTLGMKSPLLGQATTGGVRVQAQIGGAGAQAAHPVADQVAAEKDGEGNRCVAYPCREFAGTGIVSRAWIVRRVETPDCRTPWIVREYL